MADNTYLRPKYIVQRTLTIEGPDGPIKADGKKMVSTDPDDIDSPFVLFPRKDPAAFNAMLAYMQSCEPDLAAEIRDWMHKISQADPVFGTQGKRNMIAMRDEAVSTVRL